MKARYVARDKYSEFYDCGRHGNMKVRDLYSKEKMRFPDCLRCLEGDPEIYAPDCKIVLSAEEVMESLQKVEETNIVLSLQIAKNRDGKPVSIEIPVMKLKLDGEDENHHDGA